MVENVKGSHGEGAGNVATMRPTRYCCRRFIDLIGRGRAERQYGKGRFVEKAAVGEITGRQFLVDAVFNGRQLRCVR